MNQASANQATSHDMNQNSPGPDSKVHGANMGHIWVRQGPGGPHELCYLGGGREEGGGGGGAVSI